MNEDEGGRTKEDCNKARSLWVIVEATGTYFVEITDYSMVRKM